MSKCGLPIYLLRLQQTFIKWKCVVDVSCASKRLKEHFYYLPEINQIFENKDINSMFYS